MHVHMAKQRRRREGDSERQANDLKGFVNDGSHF